MSTLRTSNLIHGSSSVSNVVLDTQGRASFGPDGPNGRAALYVNPQTNRVGVNTESPAVALDVDGAINTTGNVTIGGTLNLTGDLTLSVINAGSGTAAAPSVSVGTTDNGLYSPGTDQVAISTNGTGRLFFDSSGNVGINTTPPSFGSFKYFSIKGGSTSQGGIVNVTNSDDSVSGQFASYNNLVWLQSNTNYPLVFGINGANEKMRIDSSGRVGIGTSSPSQLLSLSSAGPRILLTQTSANSNAFLDAATSGVLEFSADDNNVAGSSSMRFKVDGTERLRIDSSGNVGIGTTSPTHQLTVHNASTTGGTIEANRFSVRDNYGSLSGLGNGFISPAVNTLVLATNSTERVRIYGDGGVSLKKYLEFRNEADTAFVGYLGNGTQILTGSLGTDFAVRAETNLLFASGGNAERMRITSSGAIVLPDSSPGIQFGTVSSPASNTTLDDYEEGTFTPYLAGSIVNGTFTSTGSAGKYTKIGRSVTCNVRIEDATLSGATGAIRVRGIPYVIGASPYAVCGTMMLYRVSFDPDNVQSWYGNPNTTDIYGLESRNGTTWINWNASNFNNSSVYVVFTITYQTT